MQVSRSVSRNTTRRAAIAALRLGAPLLRARADDEVLALTLWSRDAQSALELERVARSIEADIKRVPGAREVKTIGGPGRVVRVHIDPARMNGTGVTVHELRQALADYAERERRFGLTSAQVAGSPA